MKFKKTSAALLVATLAVTGSSYAWADETLFQADEKTTEEATVSSSNQNGEAITVTTDDSATVNTGTTTDTAFPEIPEGYHSSNLLALKQAYENAGNDTAKAAILRNAEKAIAKFEAKQEALKNEEQTVIEENKEAVQETQTEEQKATEKPATPVVEKSTKEVRKTIQTEQKAERKALQEEQKVERKTLQVEQKVERKELQKEHKSEKQNLKEQQKEAEKSNKENK